MSDMMKLFIERGSSGSPLCDYYHYWHRPSPGATTTSEYATAWVVDADVTFWLLWGRWHGHCCTNGLARWTVTVAVTWCRRFTRPCLTGEQAMKAC